MKELPVSKHPDVLDVLLHDSRGLGMPLQLLFVVNQVQISALRALTGLCFSTGTFTTQMLLKPSLRYCGIACSKKLAYCLISLTHLSFGVTHCPGSSFS